MLFFVYSAVETVVSACKYFRPSNLTWNFSLTGISMSEILQYRKQFYESSYDVRVSCARGDSAEEIANKTLKTLKETQDEIGFISTREERAETDERPGFLDVVLKGLAPDGGLFVPRRQLPFFTEGRYAEYVRNCDFFCSEEGLTLETPAS